MCIFYFKFFSPGRSDQVHNIWTKHLAAHKRTLSASFWGKMGSRRWSRVSTPLSAWPRCLPVW